MTKKFRPAIIYRLKNIAIKAAPIIIFLGIIIFNISAQAEVIIVDMQVSTGYNDNIHLTRTPRSDFFIKAGPGIRADFKWPESKLTFSGDALYAHYLDLTYLSGFDRGSAAVTYEYTPTPRWLFTVLNRYSSTFNKSEVSETGDLITVRGDTGRLDRNTFDLSVRHRTTKSDYMELAYTNTYTRGEDEEDQNTLFNRLAFVYSTKVNPRWQAQVGGSLVHTTYSDNPDEDRGRAFTRITRTVGPNMQTWGEAAYAVNRSIGGDEAIQDSRDYQLLNLTFGISHNVNPRFNWSFAAGWSQVTGNSTYNSAANKGFPILNAKLNYDGRRWAINAYALADLGQFDYLGDNRGLVVSHRFGITWSYKIAKRQDIGLRAEYSRNDYKEADPVYLNNDSNNQGIVDSYQFKANWNWQINKDFRLTLEYAYLNRDSEQDSEDRKQNLITLILYTDYPFRW